MLNLNCFKHLCQHKSNSDKKITMKGDKNFTTMSCSNLNLNGL